MNFQARQHGNEITQPPIGPLYPVWPENAQQEIGSRLHWQVRFIQPVILFPVGILCLNQVLILGEIFLLIYFTGKNSWFNSLA